MTKPIPVALNACVLVFALVIGGCRSEKRLQLTPSEMFVLSRLPGELRNTFTSKDGAYFCGEVGVNSSKSYRRFYASLERRAVVYQGDHTFTLADFASRCGVGVSQAELAADQVERDSVAQSDRAAEQMAAQQKAYRKWIDTNGQAVDTLNKASKLLQ